MKPKGTLLLIGGAEDKGDHKKAQPNKDFEQFEILKSLLPKTNGVKKQIEIISTASSIPQEMNQTYKKAFAKIGYPNVSFIKAETKQEARDPKFVDRIKKSHAVLFTGGDQFTLAATLGGTPLVKLIREKYEKDKNFVVAGTSAGAMAMSKIMIFEGEINEAVLKEDVKMSTGLGIFDTCIIDTHFIKRGRFIRLANAIVMNPESLGIGLGEDTALVIKNGELAECRGSGSVTIIDGNYIGQTNITDTEVESPIYIENLIVHILANGCRFSIKDRRLAMPATRSRKK